MYEAIVVIDKNKMTITAMTNCASKEKAISEGCRINTTDIVFHFESNREATSYVNIFSRAYKKNYTPFQAN